MLAIRHFLSNCNRFPQIIPKRKRLFVLASLLLVLCTWQTSEAISAQEAGKDEAKQNVSDKANAKQERAKAKKGTETKKDKPSEKPPAPKIPITAVTGATLHTMTGRGVIKDGVLLIQRGKILSVGGADLKIPEHAKKISAKGLQITPGWIDADSKLWLTPAAASTSASDGSLKMLDGVDPFAEDWSEVVSQGITSVYVQPSSRGTLGGTGSLLSTLPKELPEVEVLRKLGAMQASIGVGASGNRTRAQQYERTKKSFNDAKAYKKKWDEYNEYLKKKEAEEKKAKEKSKKTGETKGTTSKGASSGTKSGVRVPIVRGKPAPGRPPVRPTPPSGSSSSTKSSPAASAADKKSEEKPADDKAKKPPPKPEKDPVKDLLIEVVEGKVPLRLELHSADDAFYAMKLLKDFDKLELIFEGLSNLGSATNDVLQGASPIVLGPWIQSATGYRTDPDSASVWAEFAKDYPGTLVIASNASTPRGSRLLRAHVGAAIAQGVSPETALAAVTCNAAKMLGAGEAMGTIEKGKRADLVAFLGNPTNTSTPVVHVWVRGKLAFTRDAMPAEQFAEATEASIPNSLPSVYALKSTRCLRPDGTVGPGVVEVKDGKIVTVGGAEASCDSEVFDLGDAFITPGLFSSSASLGLSSQVDPNSQPDSSYVVAADAMTQGLSQEASLLASGLLQAVLTPGSSNPLAGSASRVRIGAAEPVAKSIVAAKMVLDSRSRSTQRFPSSLAGQLQFIEQSFAGKLLDSRLFLPEPVVARLEAQRKARFESIRSGESPALIAVRDDAEVRGALNLVESLKLDATLSGAKQLLPFLDELQELDVCVLAEPISVATYNWYLRDIAMADAKGIDVAFSGESGEQLRLLASQAVASGMDANRALKALCHGSSGFVSNPGLVAGNEADLVIWSGSPLDLSAKPLLVVVDGKIVAGEDGK